MLFGSRQEFGLEAEIDEIDPARADWIFGRLCLWAGGERLGNFGRATMLSLPATFFADWVKHQGERHDEDFCRQQAELALRQTYEALYGKGEGGYLQALTLEARYRKLCLAPGGGESFDGFFAILLECDNRARLIWRTEQESNAHETWVRPGQCEAVLREFLEWLRQKSGFDTEGTPELR